MSILPLPSLTAGLNKALSHTPIKPSLATYRRHTLHYMLTGLGYLPAPLLEHFIYQLKGAPAKAYPHADAHLRLILAMSNQLKQPLTLDKLPKLREKFDTKAISLQASNV